MHFVGSMAASNERRYLEVQPFLPISICFLLHSNSHSLAFSRVLRTYEVAFERNIPHMTMRMRMPAHRRLRARNMNIEVAF